MAKPTYTRVNWQNYPNQTTPLDARHLNTMDEGIYNITEFIQSCNPLGWEGENSPSQDEILVGYNGEQKATGSSVSIHDIATQEQLSTKQDKLTAGSNITIENNVISATGGGGGSGTEVIANPTDEATSELIKIKIEDVIYSLPSGGSSSSTVITKVPDSATNNIIFTEDELTQLQNDPFAIVKVEMAEGVYLSFIQLVPNLTMLEEGYLVIPKFYSEYWMPGSDMTMYFILSVSNADPLTYVLDYTDSLFGGGSGGLSEDEVNTLINNKIKVTVNTDNTIDLTIN